MITDEQWDRLKLEIPSFDALPEMVRVVYRKHMESLVANGKSIEELLVDQPRAERASRVKFTVGELIAELQKHPADMPVFGWGESTEPELEQGEVPIPNPHLEVEEVAPVGSIWVLAEDWEDNLGKEEARAMFEAEPVKALLISWKGA